MAEKKTEAKKTVKKVVKKATAAKSAKKVVKKTTTKKAVAKKAATTKKAVVKKKTLAKVVKKPTKKMIKKEAVIIEKIESLGLWSRFWRVLTPTFLTRLGTQHSQGKSWGFWFLSNFLLVLIPTIALLVFSNYFFAEFPANLVNKIPANEQITLDNGQSYNVKSLIENFELELDENGILTSKNIPDPLVIVGNENNEGGFYSSLNALPSNSADLAFIIDTKEALDIEGYNSNFGSYFYFLRDKTVVYDGQKNQTQIINYKELLENEEVSDFPKTFNYASIANAQPFVKAFASGMLIALMVLSYLFLAVFRLLNALFWALIFWLIGAIAQVKDWNFEKSFMGMLHFSFITILLIPLAFIFEVSIFLYAFVLLGVLFGMNFWEMKKN